MKKFLALLLTTLILSACNLFSKEEKPKLPPLPIEEVEEEIIKEEVETETVSETIECEEPVEAQKYLMAFNSCLSDCDSPTDHIVFLAGSDDGEKWELIKEFDNGHAGSVPDIVFYNDNLYLFHTGAGGDHSYDILDACFNVLETDNALLEGGDEDGWVDPSLIVDGNELVLFYLPGIRGQDPASCAEGEETCIKEIHSARSSLETLPIFQLVDGARVEAQAGDIFISGNLGGFSDPDIIQLEDGSYLLYVSSGANALAYTGSDIDGTFENPNNDEELLFASKQQGGVPSAIQDPETGLIWLYVHKGEDGITTIRRSVSDGITALLESDYDVVIDNSIFDDDSYSGAFSPSIIEWPSDWK